MLCISGATWACGSARGDPDVWIGPYVWITCVLVWIRGMDRPVGSGYGSWLYILTRSHMFQQILPMSNESGYVWSLHCAQVRTSMDFKAQTKH